MRALALIAQMMVLVHTIDMRPAAINVEQITSMAPPGTTQNDKSKCLIHFNNGRFINTAESCDQVGELWRREDAKEK